MYCFVYNKPERIALQGYPPPSWVRLRLPPLSIPTFENYKGIKSTRWAFWLSMLGEDDWITPVPSPHSSFFPSPGYMCMSQGILIRLLMSSCSSRCSNGCANLFIISILARISFSLVPFMYINMRYCWSPRKWRPSRCEKVVRNCSWQEWFP